MKKAFMPLAALLLALVLSVAVYAAYIYGCFRYTVEDQSVTITAYTGKEETVTVPAMIGGDPVNTIAAGAFASNSYVKNIILPDTVTTIEAGAFSASQTARYAEPDATPSPSPSPSPSQDVEMPEIIIPSPTTGPSTPGESGWEDPTEPSTSPSPSPSPSPTPGTVPVPEPSPSPAPIPFTDVTSDDYFFPAVTWAYSTGVTKGMSDTSFSPEATVTRGQAVTFLWRAKGEPAPRTKTNPFRDVKENSYYYQAVLWAYENGITNGTSADAFSPGNPVTRGQMITFLWRTLGKPGATGTGAWYTDAENWGKENGYLTGTTQAYETHAPCPRCDVVYYLWKAVA